MKVWITRPSLWDCFVKGIGRCDMWFIKPFFDRAPRGATDLPQFSHLPKGWRVVDEAGEDLLDAIVLRVDRQLKGYPELEQQLWSAIRTSVEGATPVPESQWVKRWEQLVLEDNDEGHTSFLYEMELPPVLWFRLAQHNGFEDGTWAARHYRQLLASDCPF